MSDLVEETIRLAELERIQPKVQLAVETFVLAQVPNLEHDEIRHCTKQLIRAIVQYKLERRIEKRVQDVLTFLQSTEGTTP